MDACFALGFVHQVHAIGVLVVLLYAWPLGERESGLRIADPMCLVYALLSTAILAVHGWETWSAFMSPSRYEQHQAWYQYTGAHAWASWMHVAAAGLLPQLLWIPGIRKNVPWPLVIAAACVAWQIFEGYTWSVLAELPSSRNAVAPGNSRKQRCASVSRLKPASGCPARSELGHVR